MIISMEVPIYRCDVAFFLEVTVEELDDFYKRNKKNLDEEDYNLLKKDIEDTEKVAGAVYTCGVNYIMYVRNTKNKGHCDHELWHLTNSILSQRGVEHTETDEPYAYLNEFLHNEFRSILIQFKKDKNNEDAGGTSGACSGTDTEGEKSKG